MPDSALQPPIYRRIRIIPILRLIRLTSRMIALPT